MSRRVDAADILEIAGAVTIAVSVGAVYIPAGGIVLGAFALWFGGWRLR